MSATSGKLRSPRLLQVIKAKTPTITYVIAITTLAWCLTSYFSPINYASASKNFDRALTIAGLGRKFRAEATHNLTRWKDELFVNTVRLEAAVERRAGKVVQPEGHSRFDLFSPFVTCPNGDKLEYFGGTNDGGKLVCPSLLTVPSCVVYSLGSRLDYSFEEDILRRTPCQVVTFDCTVNGASVHPRHTFVKKCLGTAAAMKANPKEWTTLQAAMAELGHSAITFLKIDIEGSEYDVLGSYSTEDKAAMPFMISMELHYDGVYYGTEIYQDPTATSTLFWPAHGQVSLAEMSLFMNHLAQLGYAVVSRDDNPLCPHCTELTLLRVE